MRASFALLPALLLAPGCIFGNSPADIWLVRYLFQDAEEAAPDCEYNYTENYIDGRWPEGTIDDPDSEWTYTYEYESNDILGFVQIETTRKKQAVLVAGGTVYPGSWDGESKEWVFEWTNESNSSETQEHEDGYFFTENTSSASTTTIRFNFDNRNFATGKSTSRSEDTYGWTEADEWDEEATGLYYGQSPSSYYLEHTQDEFEEVYNLADDNDCDEDFCALGYSVTCTSKGNFEATRTDYDEEAAFQYLSGVSTGG